MTSQPTLLDYPSDSGKTSRRKDVPEGPQGPVNPTSLSGTPQDIHKTTKIKIPDPPINQERIKASTCGAHASKSLKFNKRAQSLRDRNWLKELPRKIREDMNAFMQACEREFPDDKAVRMYAEMFEDGVDDRVDGRRKIDRKRLKHHEKLLAQRPEDFERQYRARIAFVLLKYIQSKYPGSSEALG